MGRVQFSIHLPIKLTPKSNWVVAVCPILDVTSQGKDIAEAKRNIIEALSLFFMSCFDRGVLDEALKECGFVPAGPTQTHRVLESQPDGEYVDVPIPLLLSRKRGDPSHCHA